MGKINYQVLEIKPQAGFQEKVFGCTADIAFIGGQAGGGKTSILLMESLKWIQAADFAAVYFRRDKERIRATGGMLQESKKWFIEGELAESILKWRFPSGAQVDFEGIEHLKDLDKWLGTQIPYLCFDEVTEFEEQMFWFMISRNRGIVRWRDEKGQEFLMKPYARASCNPKPNSWVSRLLEWWIDQNTGFPIEERDGVIRYMINFNNKIYWGDTKDEVMKACPEVFEKLKRMDSSIHPHDLIKSFTFIRGRLSDNKILTKNSPEYYSSLLSMSQEDQARFLDGNWKISSNGTDLFDFLALKEMFNLNREPFEYDNFNTNNNFITCDAAKFGQDLCTIYVWQGWCVLWITVFHLSDARDIFNEIEALRLKFKVQRKNVVIDQDGIGGDVVKLGGYNGFIARRKPAVDATMRIPENYETFKDQCYFHASEKVNTGELRFLIIKSSVKIFDRGSKNPRYSLNVKWKGDLINIQVLIIEQMSAIKKGESVLLEGGEAKYRVNSKEEQKEILGGISPDLADPVMMRASFDLERRRRGVTKIH